MHPRPVNGWLKVVGTPIGNLGDLSPRALETLREADRIFAEDTRRTKQLLTHFGITGKKIIAVHAHSSERNVQAAVEMLQELNVALVTDAGMPSVSDPGSELIRGARAAGATIAVIPGPSAVTAAVALSGLVDGPFTFLGFLPRKGTKRKDVLHFVAESPIPCILFESPHRMTQTLSDLAESCGQEREVAICREITKRFEETIVAPLGEVAASDYVDEWRGEFSLVVAKFSGEKSKAWSEVEIDQRILELLQKGESKKDIAALLSRLLAQAGQKVGKRELYARVLALAEGQLS